MKRGPHNPRFTPTSILERKAFEPMSSELPTSLRFLTQKQLAELLNLSERTLERWRVEGRGPKFVAMGPRRRLYRLTDVDEWAKAQTFESTAAVKR
jgi:excisionase family DNA binding protein